MHAGQGPDDFQVAEFFGSNVHKKVFAMRVLAVEALNSALHRGRWRLRSVRVTLCQILGPGSNSYAVHELFNVAVRAGEQV